MEKDYKNKMSKRISTLLHVGKGFSPMVPKLVYRPVYRIIENRKLD